ncbi:unnamed protein product [Rhizoctonia solani]|uniref:Uncharacterized protein n=1 Tax=Rhizoctonia solani TaxID=456999 RepID=A0A8H3C881_9AGAM|nr:unnamed protein product [Rhizoctonia solani]CAE6473865.1 unnamed protein product [Rhizoctonia solani]
MRWTSPHAAVYGTMDTSLLFSKLSPHLGNLAPNAIQIVYDSLKYGDRSGNTEPEIVCCVWIPDTHITALESWTGLDGHTISVLVTTSHLPNSPAFQKLTKDVARIIHPKSHLKGTIVLVSTQTWLSNNNAYINLARLFARADWVLLVPPMLEPLLPGNNFARTMSRLGHQAQTLGSSLLFRSPNNQGQTMGGILIPQSTPMWCSERYYLSNVGHEWSDCIQDLLAYHHKLGASNSTKSIEDVEQQKR